MLEKLKPGDITEPLRAAKGYQILKVETLTQATPQPFDASGTWWPIACTRRASAPPLPCARAGPDPAVPRDGRMRSQALIEWSHLEPGPEAG
jgi:hypothetical protein